MYVDTTLETPTLRVTASAQSLGITERELEALLWVRESLIDGTIKHDRHCDFLYQNGFNMRKWNACHGTCNTIHCIGGWMQHRLEYVGPDAVCLATGPMQDLFHPGGYPL